MDRLKTFGEDIAVIGLSEPCEWYEESPIAEPCQLAKVVVLSAISPHRGLRLSWYFSGPLATLE